MATENAQVDAAPIETDAAQMDKFAGFAVKDGEVIKAAAPAAKQNANAKPIAAKGAAKAEGADEQGAEGDDDGDKHNSAEKRIGQAVGRQRAAERRADKAERDLAAVNERVARLEGAASAGGLTPQQKAATAPKAPEPKDYDGGEYDARYLADVAKFEARQAVAEATKTVRTESQAAALTQEQQRAVAAFTKARDDFAAKATETYDDFEDVVFDDANPVTATLAELSMDSEHGARIMYELAQDRKEATRVSKLSAARQAAWFGRQEAALEDPSDDTDAGDGDDGDGEQEQRSSARQSGPKAKVSKAPPVPEYNARGNGAVPKTSAATPDFAAFERLANGAQKQR